MKGVIIERATPGNVLDVYALIKEAHKEGKLPYPKPSDDQLREHYFRLLNELADPHQVYLLAKKGRTYWGYMHSTLALRPFGVQRYVFIKNIYVAEKKRKLGIAKQMYETLRGQCKKMGIGRAEFMCQDEQIEHWAKKVKAQKHLNFMATDV